MEITSEVVHVAEFDRIVAEQIKIAAVKARERERERERERAGPSGVDADG